MDIYKFWKDVLDQNADALRDYFDKNAVIRWHCTNELFTAEDGPAPEWRQKKNIRKAIQTDVM